MILFIKDSWKNSRRSTWVDAKGWFQDCQKMSQGS